MEVAALTEAEIHFSVPGRPVPKERARVRKDGHRYTPRRTAEYEELVGWYCRQAMGTHPPLDGPVMVCICLHYRTDAPLADVDNVAKAILDGMEGVAYRSDRQVSGLMVFRRARTVRNEYAEVTVWPSI